MDRISQPRIEDPRFYSISHTAGQHRTWSVRSVYATDAASRTSSHLQAFERPLTSRLHRLGASRRIGVVSRLLSPLRGLREGERERGMLNCQIPLN